jgi:hypothetical protein
LKGDRRGLARDGFVCARCFEEKSEKTLRVVEPDGYGFLCRDCVRYIRADIGTTMQSTNKFGIGFEEYGLGTRSLGLGTRILRLGIVGVSNRTTSIGNRSEDMTGHNSWRRL